MFSPTGGICDQFSHEVDFLFRRTVFTPVSGTYHCRPSGRPRREEDGWLQKVLQYFTGIYCIHIPLAPILFFWNLCIQDGAILSYQFALFASYFFYDCRITFSFGIVKNIKFNWMSVALHLCQYAVFLFRSLFYSYIMLCNTAEHIFTFSYVNDLIVQLDTVNAWVFIFGG